MATMAHRSLSVIGLLLLVTFFTSMAQQKTAVLRGTVVDSAGNQALEYVTVNIRTDSAAIKTILTDASGKFELPGLAPGKYVAAFVAVGYKSRELPIELTADMPELDLRKIELSSEAETLDEVVITATRPIVKQDIDRLTYDVQADPESKILTALDLMRKVPLLSVDGDENVLLQGNGNYRIFINNKPSDMIARNPKEVLKAMPAESIEKIEVITTPPARYESEGLAGIINIITNKNVDNGYRGSVNLNYRAPAGGPGVGGSVTIKQGKFGASAYFGGSLSQRPQTQSNYERTTHIGQPNILLQNGFNEGTSNFTYLGTELSYDIDSLNLITGEIGVNLGQFGNDLSQFSNTSTFDGAPIQEFNLYNRGKSRWGGYHGGLNYQKGFKQNKDQLLTFSYRFSSYTDAQDNRMRITERFNYQVPDYNQTNDGTQDEHTVQLDYVHPVSKLNIEGGVKGIFRLNNSDFRSANFDEATGSFVEDPTQTNTYENNQYILSAYNSYQYKLEKWGFSAGLRAEQTIVKADFISSHSNVDQNYFNFIPSIAINHILKQGKTLNLGYTQRVQRPGIWNLNPFVDRSNPNFEYSGNPDLRPVLNNNFNLRYSSFGKASINIGLNYSFANNTIQRLINYNAETGVSRFTFENIGKDRSLGTNISINYPITKKLNLNVSGDMSYIWLEGIVDGEETRNSGMRGYIYGGLSYMLDDGWRLNGNFSYSTPYIMLQGQSNAFPYYGISASKDLIKEKLSLSGSISNPFNKFRNYINDMAGPSFTQSSFSQNYYRSFNMSLSYRFGRLKDEIRKNRRGIKNDDSAGGGQQGGN
ncbi:Outer membrane receptor proteins, mostly Fe transport [Parapedobacter luteus]|uniref:Outer membrane receptor proteins, mostly Fe transport n=2 Tax=Parapedobacter luteus TaxID=623280 RepID=A0A1T5BJ41_9SPHI|nr:Outer membrane receptor proteins, mostly Fe transport [Parapedobacter luteus]